MGARGKTVHRTPKEMNLASLARSYTHMAIHTIAGICQNGTSEMARLAAATILLERGWGKPAQAHTGENGEGPITVEIVYRAREPREPAQIVELKPIDGGPNAAA